MTQGALAAEAFVRSIRTGEHSASLALAPWLAADVVLETNGPMANSPTETLNGRDAVLARASGNWAVTYALRHARWSDPHPEGAAFRVDASFDYIGGVSPAAMTILVSLDAKGKISRIEQKYTPKQAKPADRIPASVRPLVNNARINETPLVFGYTDENGIPCLSFRGSVQVLNDLQLCAWIRNAESNLVKSLAKHPAVSLVYRDGPRAMLFFQGRAHIDNSDEMRNRVFEITPEVERNHDPARHGTALIIDVDKIMGYATGGELVRMARKA